ncbi:hypothetical protein ACFL1N_05005 [Thermodesulfobacteriota bacterium]
MNENVPNGKKQLHALLSAIFLTSLCVIAFEITLTRILSVLLSHHYVFVVLSLALLGLGAGGIFVYFFRSETPHKDDKSIALSLISSMFSLAVPLSVIFIIRIEYINNIQVAILFYCLVLVVPFFLAGMLLAEIFLMFPSMVTMVYGSDLIGAAAGSLITIPLLNVLGGVSTSLALGIIASLAALFFAMGDTIKNHKGFIISILSFSGLSVLFALNIAGVLRLDIPIGSNQTKEIHDALSSLKGKIIETKWSSFGRTDLVEFSDYPGHMDIYIDGTAGSPMYRFSGDVKNPGTAIKKIKNSFPGYFPFFHLQEKERNNALVIGPGGGRDILLMLMGGVQQIKAVEINKDLVDMVRRYSWFNGGIYTDLDNVTIIVDEGRSFLKRQKDKFDIIMLSLPVTNTSRSPEGYALTENFIFTTDSINDYLDHLTDEGRLIVIGHNDAEVLRLLSLSLAVLNKRGVDTGSAMNRVYITGSDEYLVYVLKKTPFEPAKTLQMYRALPEFGLDPALSYFPFIRQSGAINPVLMALSDGNIVYEDFLKMVKDRGYDISPVTDNSPFFYKFETRIPKPVSVVFWSSMILLTTIILIPSLYLKRKVLYKDSLRSMVLFSMLGMGFMLIEIPLIQRFVLFLGYPVLSLAVLLGSILGSAGVGSLWSSRFGLDKTSRAIAITSMSIIFMVLCYAFILPVVLEQLLGLDLVIRVLASILILIPIGFLMGIPFPLGIRLLKESGLENHIPWMWGINGVSAVFGSVMTILVSISFGFTEALLLSSCCYFFVLLTFIKT